VHRRGDPKPTGHMWRRQTLSELTKRRRRARMWCEACGHETVHSPVYMAMFFGVPYETTLYALAQRLHCKKCSSKRVGIAITAD
jgi:Zn finger protein HypA/HybF involved in hydrogenase expression